jgi:hypothetical protein
VEKGAKAVDGFRRRHDQPGDQERPLADEAGNTAGKIIAKYPEKRSTLAVGEVRFFVHPFGVAEIGNPSTK